MKKNKIIFLAIIVLLITGSVCLFKQNNNEDIVTLADNSSENIEKNVKENIEKNIEELINISECPEEFMDNYFKESQQLEEENNKENILIVTSKEEIKDEFGASKVIEAPNNQYFLQYDSEEEKNKALEEIKNVDSTISVEENIIRTATDYNSWGIEKTGLNYAIEVTNGKNLNEVTVAIIDTGCNMELFNANYSGRIEETYNVLNPGSDMVDEHGHGTHIAGTIAEGTPSNVKILPIKVSTDGNMYTSDIIEAINYIVYYDKADVINMSYGGYEYSEAEYLAVEAANEENIISVAAAGNDNVSTEHYPASFDNTISISSVDSNLNKSTFSNYGSTITFAAPGTSILSINGTKSGTSMATPHAVSAIAILKSYNQDITLDNTIELLKRHAIDLGDKGYDKYYGYGFINFYGAEFYDGTNGDEFNVFKNDESEAAVEKIESTSSTYSVLYNYGNITNLMNAKLKIYYSENNYYTKALWELDDIEISGYQANSKTEQIVTIKYKDTETTLTINNSYVNDGWGYSKLDDNTIILTSFEYSTNPPVKVYIPEEYDGYTVTSIGEKLFTKTIVESVIVPSCVTTIESAFYDADYLKNISLTNGLIKIGNNAFYGAGNLKSIVIPNTVTEIGTSAFYTVPLESIVLSENLISIGNAAFRETTQLKNIKLPNNLETIGNSAFKDSGLESIEIPASVNKIEGFAFSGCKNLKTVTLSDGLETIENNVFALTSVESMFIPKTVTSIGQDLLWQVACAKEVKVDEENRVYDSRNNCNAIIETATNKLITGIDNTIIPADVKIIGEDAFSGYTKEIIIPEGVEEIESYAFGGFSYSDFVKIVLPKSLTTISSNAFKTITYYNTSSGHIEYPENLVLWVYNASTAHSYAKLQEVAYQCIDPSQVLVNYLNKVNYIAFETVDTEDFSLLLTYEDGRKEYIEANYEITYMNGNDSFRAGDTYFTVSAYNTNGILIEKQVEVTVEKVIPEYEIPTNISAIEGQALSEIELPSGFEWMDSSQIYDSNNTMIYKAKFIPDDTTNYEVVEDIEITVYSQGRQATYNVEHYKENLDGTYTLAYRHSYSFFIGMEITLPTSEFVGFTTPAEITVKVTEGEKTYKYDYTRNSYTVNVEAGEGVKEVTGAGTYKYEEEVILGVVYEEEYDNIIWSGDYTTNTFIMPANDVNMSVKAIKLKTPSVSYRSHVQNIGWENSWKYNGELSGTVGKCWRLEGLQVCLHDAPYEGTIEYRSHVQTIGWEKPWRTHSQVSGSVGKSLRVEAIQIKLTDEMAEHYDIYYRLQIQDYGWLGWAKNGQSAGSEGHSKKVEAIEIKLVKKGEAAPGSTERRFVRASGLKYRTHVQNIGWMPYVDENGLAGTSGKSLRVEAFQLLLTTTQYDGGIRYRGNIQNQGWEAWKYDKQESGTNGKGLRMEAFQIELYGDVANYYDVYYRVHVQNIGWMGWAKNGQSAGTEGYGYRIESFQIQLVDKGGEAPGNTTDCFRSK